MRMLVATLACLISATSFGQHASWAWGGQTTCGEAMQSIEKYGEIQETLYRQWLLGYLSGLNLGLSIQGKKAVMTGKGVSADTIAAMFKNECRQDALKTIHQAAFAVYVTLQQRVP